jgi:hypothetical protein
LIASFTFTLFNVGQDVNTQSEGGKTGRLDEREKGRTEESKGTRTEGRQTEEKRGMKSEKQASFSV